MTDIVSKKKRSLLMSGIKASNTKPEIIVKYILTKTKYKFAQNDRRLPGTPDFSFYNINSVIFVHGCFWHLHRNCKKSNIPKSNNTFWMDKLMGNKKRDRLVKLRLTKMGWRYLTVWECETDKDKLAKLTSKIKSFLSNK